MRTRPLLMLCLLPWLVALCSCATPAPRPIAVACPKPQPVPAPLMRPLPKPLRTACRLQSLLFVPATKQTPGNVCSALK